jgi:hypothetical protein
MRRSVTYLPLLVPVLVAVALLAVFLRTMGHKAPPLLASNSVPLQGLVVQIGHGSDVCQTILAPRGAGIAQFFVLPLDTTKGPALSMRLGNSGRTLATSHIAGGWTGDKVRFSFPALSETYPSARVCVRNEGRTLLRFTGLSNPPSTNTTVNGQHESAVIAAEFFGPQKKNAWSMLPTIARRAGILHGAIAGAWSFWVAAAFVLLAGATALALSLRSLRR